MTERSTAGLLVAGGPIAPMRGRPSADHQALAALIPLCSRAVRLADASLKAARVVSLRLFQDRLISVCPFPSRLALQKMRGRLGRPPLYRPGRLRRPWRPPWARPGGVCPYPPWSPGRWPPVGPGVVWSPIPSRALWWMWAVPATGRRSGRSGARSRCRVHPPRLRRAGARLRRGPYRSVGRWRHHLLREPDLPVPSAPPTQAHPRLGTDPHLHRCPDVAHSYRCPLPPCTGRDRDHAAPPHRTPSAGPSCGPCARRPCKGHHARGLRPLGQRTCRVRSCRAQDSTGVNDSGSPSWPEPR